MKNVLLDFAQGASNAAADTVGAPVDGLAWLLRKAGLPIPQAPIGGSEWMTRQGLRAEPQNALAGALGGAAIGFAPMVGASRAVTLQPIPAAPAVNTSRASLEAALSEQWKRDREAFSKIKKPKFTEQELRMLREIGYDL